MSEILFITDEQKLRRIIREELQGGNNNNEEKEFKERLDRKEAARFLGIAYQTMYHWIKAGIIEEHGHGRKKYFIKSQLISALENKVG